MTHTKNCLFVQKINKCEHFVDIDHFNVNLTLFNMVLLCHPSPRQPCGAVGSAQVSPQSRSTGERRIELSHPSQTSAGREAGACCGLSLCSHRSQKLHLNRAVDRRKSVFQRNYTVYINKVPVADADLMATNGVVHAVRSIIRPLRECLLLLLTSHMTTLVWQHAAVILIIIKFWWRSVNHKSHLWKN